MKKIKEKWMPCLYHRLILILWGIFNFTFTSTIAEVELGFDPSKPALTPSAIKHKQTFSYRQSFPRKDSDIRMVIDDFEKNPITNYLGGVSGTWDKNPMDMTEGCSQSLVYDAREVGKNKVLKLQYDVDASSSVYNGYWTRLNGIDLTPFHELRFRVKGDPKGYTEVFKIELKNSFQTRSIYVNGVGEQWKEVIIPLKQFKTLKNMAKVNELVIIFEDRIANPQKEGVLYFDDFTLIGSPAAIERASEMDRRALSEELFKMLEMDDSLLLEILQKKIFQYFENEADSKTGLIKDRNVPGAPASIAATGFGLVAFAIAGEHGWLAKAEAYQKILKILQTLENEAAHENGFFYHFLDPGTGKRWGDSEVSTMDTSLLMAGVLFVRQYFPDTEVSLMASRLYERVRWDWMAKTPEGLLFMQWKPEAAFEGSPVWDMAAEEMILYLLAMGSPTHPLSDEAWHQWRREKFQIGDIEFMSDPGLSLFTNLYSHSFIDFREKQDDFMDYWENARRAVLANRKFCMMHKNQFEGYGPWGWGLSASDGPLGYQAYGAKEGAHDGTLAPYAVIASLPLASQIVLPTLRHMLAVHGEKIWGPYGPTSAYNVEKGWYSTEYIGIDQGIMLLMIENYRSGTVWNYFMKEPVIQRAMAKAGFNPPLSQTEYRPSKLSQFSDSGPERQKRS